MSASHKVPPHSAWAQCRAWAHKARHWQPQPHTLMHWQRWSLWGMALPLAVFILLTVLWPQPKAQVHRVQQVDMWVQDLGPMVLTQAQVQAQLYAAPQLQQAQWTPITLPHSQPLPESIDLPDNAPKALLWLRIHLPPALRDGNTALPPGQMGLMGNRVLGGPWAVWLNGELMQASVRDWRIAWNVPLRVAMPTATLHHSEPEILLAVLYPQAKGYGVGSMFIGPIDDVDQAWRERNLWHVGISTVTAAIALTMTLTCLQLALMRRQEPIYGLLTLTAFMWLASGFQYTHDFSDNDALSLWFGWAVDASINWIIALSFLFAFAFESLNFPRLKFTLLIYAVVSTTITLPLWGWDKNALVLQHILNLALFVACAGIMTMHAWRKRSRESVLLALANWLQFFFGIHSIFRLTNQSHPDDLFLFQLSSIFLFAVFMYVTNRRYAQTLQAAEQHELQLQQQLAAQALQLQQQHQEIRQLELAQELARQRQAFALDVHDRLGGLLVSAKHQAHEQNLSQHDMLSMLEDIGHEVRAMSSPKVHRPTTITQTLADLHQRMAPRLKRLGIQLHWQVAINLPEQTLLPAHTRELQALLSEAFGNVLKHARASQIEVQALLVEATTTANGDPVSASAPNTATVCITIRDNGQGFDPVTAQHGQGLDSMQSRAQRLGAELHIHSQKGQGCVWRLRMQCKTSC